MRRLDDVYLVFQSALPGLVDQKEITAALRQCNYDPEEVISVYLAMFGEILLQTSQNGDHNYTDLNSFRSAANISTSSDYRLEPTVSFRYFQLVAH